jgi:protoporphyrinogen IX oxidase
MSPSATYQWIVAIHVFGIVLWTAGMFACLRMLAAHGAVGKAAPEGLILAERRTAVLMDIGATIAILTGVYMTFFVTPSPLTTGGWLHAKLTLVVLGVLGLHVFARVKVRKFRNGDVRPLPGFALPVFLAVVLGVIVLVQVKPF